MLIVLQMLMVTNASINTSSVASNAWVDPHELRFIVVVIFGVLGDLVDEATLVPVLLVLFNQCVVTILGKHS